MKNCVDIVRPLAEAITEREDVQLIGGIGSAALVDERTYILPEEKRIVAPADLFLAQYRGEDNLRDVEAIVFSTSDQRKQELRELAEDLIKGQLEKDILKLRPAQQLEEQRQHPKKSAELT